MHEGKSEREECAPKRLLWILCFCGNALKGRENAEFVGFSRFAHCYRNVCLSGAPVEFFLMIYVKQLHFFLSFHLSCKKDMYIKNNENNRKNLFSTQS